MTGLWKHLKVLNWSKFRIIFCSKSVIFDRTVTNWSWIYFRKNGFFKRLITNIWIDYANLFFVFFIQEGCCECMFNNRIQLFIISRMIAHTAQLLKKDWAFFLGGGLGGVAILGVGVPPDQLNFCRYFKSLFALGIFFRSHFLLWSDCSFEV